MTKGLKYISVTVFTFVFLFTACEKMKYDCENDEECKKILVGLWEEQKTLDLYNSERRFEFLETGMFNEYEYDTQKEKWVIDSSEYVYGDTLYYEIKNKQLIITYANGDIKRSYQLDKLKTDKMKLTNGGDYKFKKVK